MPRKSEVNPYLVSSARKSSDFQKRTVIRRNFFARKRERRRFEDESFRIFAVYSYYSLFAVRRLNRRVYLERSGNVAVSQRG